MIYRHLLNGLFAAIAIIFTQSVFAHFHYELPVKNVLQTNAKNQLTAMQITWTYDDEVSGLMLKDQKNVKKLGAKLINDLAKLGYFTSLKLNGKGLETNTVESYQLVEIKHKDYSNLKLDFTLPLKTPVSLQGNNTLVINHEDATDSAIIYYDKPKLLELGKLNSHCKVDIKEKGDFEEGESPQIVKVLCKG